VEIAEEVNSAILGKSSVLHRQDFANQSQCHSASHLPPP
jgi:hypothetical protein